MRKVTGLYRLKKRIMNAPNGANSSHARLMSTACAILRLLSDKLVVEPSLVLRDVVPKWSCSDGPSDVKDPKAQMKLNESPSRFGKSWVSVFRGRVKRAMSISPLNSAASPVMEGTSLFLTPLMSLAVRW